MDFYTYYLRSLEKRPDQVTTLQSCRDMALKLLDGGLLTWSIERAVPPCWQRCMKRHLGPGLTPCPSLRRSSRLCLQSCKMCVSTLKWIVRWAFGI